MVSSRSRAARPPARRPPARRAAARAAGRRRRPRSRAGAACRRASVVGALVQHVGEAEALERARATSSTTLVVAPSAPPPVARRAPSRSRDRERQRLERRQSAEELVDLEGADQAAPHPRLAARGAVMSSPSSSDRGRRSARSTPVSRLTKRGLAGAVRADQRMARAALELERHVVGRSEAAEALREAAGLAGRRRHRSRAPARASQRARGRRSQPLAADQHEQHQEQADPELPVLRRQVATAVLQELEHDRADRCRHRASRRRR